MAEVGDAFEHIRTGDDCDYRTYSDLAVDAVRHFTDLDRTVHLSYGDYPARLYLKHTGSFRGFRVYDIARWIGAGPRLPDELVQEMWEQLVPEMEAWRAIGLYGPAVAVPDDASLQDRLLGLSGRDPQRAAGPS